MFDLNPYSTHRARAEAVLDEVDRLREEREIDPPGGRSAPTCRRCIAARSAAGSRAPVTSSSGNAGKPNGRLRAAALRRHSAP